MEPQIYIYHNTMDEPVDSLIASNTAPLYLNSQAADLTSTKIYNNYSYGDMYVINGNLTYLQANHWVSDYNTYVRKSTAWDGTCNQAYAQGTLGIDLNSLWSTSSPGFTNYATDMSLTSTSPARNRATNLTTVFGFTPPGTLSADCGALAYGTPMPQYYPFNSLPTISNLSPNSGGTAGGTSVTLTGTNLTGTTAVSFGGTAATGIVNMSATQVRCTSPAHAAGSVSVTATSPNGTSNGAGYTYNPPAPTLTNVSPTSGTTSGGTSVTLTGTNFVSGATVSFGGTAATNVVVVSSTQITCTSPANAAGGVSVTVTTAGGTSSGVSFTYTASAPTLSGLSPASGSMAGGTSVTLTGTNLTGTTAVSFGGTAATGIVNMSTTQVRCTSPAHAAGGVNVTATTAGGVSNTVPYTYSSTSYTNTLNPTADGWVDSTAPTSNFATDSYPKLQSWNGNKWRYLIMKFDLTGISGSTITSAKLRMYKWQTSTAAFNVDVTAIADDSWTETGVTWNNRPTKGASVGQISVPTSTGYKEWTITSYVNTEFAGNKLVSLYVDDESNQNVATQWTAKEKGTGYKPELVVISQ